MSEINKNSKSRGRMITLSTAGSFFSFENARNISRSRILDLLEDQSQSFQLSLEKSIELYFKVDAKTAKVNEMCFELLKRENSLHQLKKCVLDKEKEVLVDDAVKSVILLKEEQEVDELQGQVDKLENDVYNMENRCYKDSEFIEIIQSDITKFHKDLQEKNKISQVFNRIQTLEAEAKQELFVLKEKKEKIFQCFLLNNKKLSALNHENGKLVKFKSGLTQKYSLEDLNESIEKSRNFHEELRGKIREIRDVSEIKKIEINEFRLQINEKNHELSIRKGWIQDLAKVLESKKKLLNLTDKQLKNRETDVLNRKIVVQSCLDDLDQMEARLEAQEIKQHQNEACFKQELHNLIKAIKKKSGYKTVTFR